MHQSNNTSSAAQARQVTSSEAGIMRTPTEQHTFVVATWNVLADGLAQSGGWIYVRSDTRSNLQ
jgi:hypothetical protein